MKQAIWDSYEVKAFNGVKGLASLESEWSSIAVLVENIPFYQRVEWYSAYLTHLEPEPDKVFFFTVYKDHELVLIFPLRLSQSRHLGFRFKVWETPRRYQIDLADLVLRDREDAIPAFQALLSELRTNPAFEHDAILLDLVLEGSNIWSLVTKGLKNKIITHADFSKFLVCDSKDSWGTGKFRRNLRRLEKRLGNQGELTWQFAHTLEECREAFPDFLTVEAAGWKGDTGSRSAIMLHPKIKEFYSEILEKFGAIGKSRINLLKINGQAIAGQFCLMDGSRINLLKIGHDQDFKNSSPGFLLIKEVFEDGYANNKFKELSFVTGSEWNDIFRPQTLKIYNIAIANITIKGYFFYFIYKFKQTLKRLIKRNR